MKKKIYIYKIALANLSPFFIHSRYLLSLILFKRYTWFYFRILLVELHFLYGVGYLWASILHEIQDSRRQETESSWYPQSCPCLYVQPTGWIIVQYTLVCIAYQYTWAYFRSWWVADFPMVLGGVVCIYLGWRVWILLFSPVSVWFIWYDLLSITQ